MVDTAVTVWQKSPQRAAQAVDRLMAHRLVSGADILNWVFQWSGFNSLNIQLQNGLAWEIIYNAVNKTLARTQVNLVSAWHFSIKACQPFQYHISIVSHSFAQRPGYIALFMPLPSNHDRGN